MIARILILCCVGLRLFSITVDGQFGMNKNKVKVPEDDLTIEKKEEPVNFDDPELLGAIQTFATLTPEELKETMDELQEIFKDDPETFKEIEEVMTEVAKLDPSEIESTMAILRQEDKEATEIADTLQMLREADEEDWSNVLANKDEILQSVIASGVMSDEEIELFQNDPTAWESELGVIWDELMEQAEKATHDEL